MREQKRERRVTVTVSVAVATAIASLGGARAGPSSGVVRAGAATISTNAAATTITQTSDRAVIDWSSFSIASGETVTFNQPSSQSAVLNRVTGTEVSSLQGSLSANGQVFLVNPNGILIGGGAKVDVGSFVATTANIDTASFMSSPAAVNGRYAFDQLTSAAAAGSIVNSGAITAADGGLVALVAPAVRNSGIITARLGKVALASANIFTLDLFGDDLVRLAVSDQIASALTDVSGSAVKSQVDMGGQIQADGGKIVLLSVPAAIGVVDAAINLSGIARAQTVAAGQEGQILLLANGAVQIGGAIDATGQQPGLPGGTIEAFGSSVHVLSPAHIDASGGAGGGLIALGGQLDLGGGSFETGTTTVDYGATVASCGTPACSSDGSGGSGNGGTVRLYSSGGTELDGRIDISSAQGSFAGTAEVLSNLGTTTLGTMSQIVAHTGSGNAAGFAVVIGDELSVGPGVLMDMRDYAGNENPSLTRRLYDASDPTLRTYVLSSDPNSLPVIQTSDPIVFHAYNPDAQGSYVAQLPARNDPTNGIEASGYTTPVGTLRPNGGAPTTVVSTAADALTAIPVSFSTDPGSSNAPPSSPPAGSPSGSPSGTPGGSTGGSPSSPPPASTGSSPSPSPGDTPPVVPVGNPDASIQLSELTQVADQITRVSRADVPVPGSEPSATPEAPPQTPIMPLLVGSPGVAQVADLGRVGAVPGALPDVFHLNYQVVAPASEGPTAPIADYLCKTPFALNGCPRPSTPR